jgi:uncharacterized protein YdhG (YjbR/CyaY superfamily)
MEHVKRTTKKVSHKTTAATGGNGKSARGFTAEEKSAMKERAKELKASEDKAEAESIVMAKIEEMQEPDRSMARRIHAIIKANIPSLTPKTWYGMPAYANKEGKVVCFFQAAQKFNARYATFGFNDSAHLDEGSMWPIAFALKELSAAEEAKITQLVKRAAG